MVINTYPHDKPGTHWVCLYLDEDTAEYFDSYYGFPPCTLKSTSLFIKMPRL